ncbi:hypothetical protein [Aestuariivirga sp.]|uniref:hypothetical protein n=1 Tax=Aestuariivirga sp. TaxID=2650926 RepID=UPI0039E611EE
MIRNILIIGTAVAALSAPAMAATTFYATMDSASKKCSVSETKPDGKTIMMIGKAGFKTKAKAEAAIKADKSCAA